jgi:hypothetical protein
MILAKKGKNAILIKSKLECDTLNHFDLAIKLI